VKGFFCVTAAVLVAIGIGLAVVGGLPAAPQVRSYGHGLFSFSAAFTSYEGGQLSVDRIPDDDTPDLVTDAVRTNDYDVDVIAARDDTTFGRKVISLLVASFLAGYRTHTAFIQGAMATLAYPTCDPEHGLAPGVCSDVEVVRIGNVTWIARALVRSYTPTLAQDFVQSFRPAS
jgi:hypothetical protein